MRVTRLSPVVFGSCLFLVVLLALLAQPGMANAGPEGEATVADAPILDEIENPAGNPDYWVRWSAVTDTISYTLQEDSTADFTAPNLRYTGDLTATQVTGQAGGTWFYRVKAVTPEGDTPWSNVVSTTVFLPAPLLNPIVNPTHSGDYTIDWELVTGTITYTLEEDESDAFGSPVVRFQGAMTSFEVTDQQPGLWYYRVRAENKDGASPWSNVESTHVLMSIYLPLVVNRWPPLPYQPVLAPISNPDGDGAYEVSWSETPERLADTYTLQEATNSSFSANLRTVCTTAQQSCPVTDRPAGTFYYRVRGQNEWGYGNWSDPRSIVVSPPPILLNGGFEQGPGVGWEEFSSHGWPIILPADQFPSGVNPRSGSWAAWLGGEHDELSLVAQEVTIPSGSPFLLYWIWIDSDEDWCGYDLAGVVVYPDTVVDVFALCKDTNTGGWVQRSVDLSGYSGQTIVFDIRSETDFSVYSSLYVDDVSLASGPLGTSVRATRSGVVVSEPKSEVTAGLRWLALSTGKVSRLLTQAPAASR